MSTVECSNCHEQICSTKILLHERMCKFNVKYCNECKEVFEIDEYDDHVKTHELNKNRQEFTPEEMSLKKKKSIDMIKRLESKHIDCRYCGLNLSLDNILSHEEQCGARTKECNHCHQLLLFKNYKSHLESKHNITLDNNNNEIPMKKDENLDNKPYIPSNNNIIDEDEDMRRAIAASLEENSNRLVKTNSQIQREEEDELSRAIAESLKDNQCENNQKDNNYDDYDYDEMIYEEEYNNYNNN